MSSMNLMILIGLGTIGVILLSLATDILPDVYDEFVEEIKNTIARRKLEKAFVRKLSQTPWRGFEANETTMKIRVVEHAPPKYAPIRHGAHRKTGN